MSGALSMNGRKKLATLQREFTGKFPYLTILFLDGDRQTLDPQRTLASVRTQRGADLSIRSSLKVQTLQARCLDHYGLVVEVGYSRRGHLIRVPESVNKTLGELNTWCAAQGYDPLDGAQAGTLQDHLMAALRTHYPDAIVKKINTDHFVDIHLPSVHPRRGTHLFFNTAGATIHFGFVVRDEEFVAKVLAAKSGLERYAHGVRPAGNPAYNTVADAAKAALTFLALLSDHESSEPQNRAAVPRAHGTEEDGYEDLDDNPDPGHTGCVFSISFSPSGHRLVSGGADHTVRMWDVGGGSLIRTLEGYEDYVVAVAYSPDGRHIAEVGPSGVRLWDSETGAVVRTFSGDEEPAPVVAYARGGQHLAVGSTDGSIRIWEPSTGKLRHTLTGHDGQIYGLAFSPDGCRLVSTGEDGTLRIRDTFDGTELHVLTRDDLDCVTHYGVTFSPDGLLIASGGSDESSDGNVRMWDASTRTLLRTLEVGADPYAVAFSPDGRWLASGGRDRVVRVWDASTGKVLHILRGHAAGVMTVAFSPDGRYLASAGEDTTIRLWDPASGAPLRTLGSAPDDTSAEAEEDETAGAEEEPEALELYQAGEITDSEYTFTGIGRLDVVAEGPEGPVSLTIVSAAEADSDDGAAQEATTRRAAITALAALADDTDVDITAHFSSGPQEMVSVKGLWKGRAYRMRAVIGWSSGQLESNDIGKLTTGDFVRLLATKELSQITQDDLGWLVSGSLLDGNIELEHLQWNDDEDGDETEEESSRGDVSPRGKGHWRIEPEGSKSIVEVARYRKEVGGQWHEITLEEQYRWGWVVVEKDPRQAYESAMAANGARGPLRVSDLGVLNHSFEDGVSGDAAGLDSLPVEERELLEDAVDPEDAGWDHLDTATYFHGPLSISIESSDEFNHTGESREEGMDYQTVIGFYIDSSDGPLSTKEVADRIEALGKRLVEVYPTYEWGVKDGGNGFIVDAKGMAAAFASFVAFIRSTCVDDEEDGACLVPANPPQRYAAAERYADEDVDIEEGNMRFHRSFEVSWPSYFRVYVNTEKKYASEIERLSLGEPELGISCDMNDVDGDYFEFEV